MKRNIVLLLSLFVAVMGLTTPIAGQDEGKLAGTWCSLCNRLIPAGEKCMHMRHWVYVGTSEIGTNLYYDSNSFQSNTGNKTFKVDVKYVYTSSGKQDVIRWLKERNRYTADYENLSYVIAGYNFNYGSGQHAWFSWEYDTDQGKRIDGEKAADSDSGPDWKPIDTETPEYVIYQKVKSDFNL